MSDIYKGLTFHAFLKISIVIYNNLTWPFDYDFKNSIIL